MARTEDDNLIDWSAFEEKEQNRRELDGSKQLRVVSLVVLGIALAGIAFGIAKFLPVYDMLVQMGDAAYPLLQNLAIPLFIIFYGLLTIIPATFGLQTAQTPNGFVAPTVLGLAGIVGSAACGIILLIAGVVDMLGGGSAVDLPAIAYFFVCTLASAVYLFFVVRVHEAANAAGDDFSHRRRPTKEELWDEDNIWK